MSVSVVAPSVQTVSPVADAPPVQYEFVHADAFTWLARRAPQSIHAVVTDPPYGLVEFSPDQLEKRANGVGVWRRPPAFDGAQRQPLPRFTVLSDQDKANIGAFFERVSTMLYPVLVPGAHGFIATNPLVAHLVIGPLIAAGFELRGFVIREVRTLRGGDRPKNAEEQFPDVTVMPKSCFEPWVVFRRPCEGRVQDNLRRWGTGGLRRLSDDEPFKDLIPSSRTSKVERMIAPHPTLKPQAFLRTLVRSSLPMRVGTVLDPFAGSGSTLAAAEACGLDSIGIEHNADYCQMGRDAIPKLAALDV